jgi:hypothetical protein
MGSVRNRCYLRLGRALHRGGLGRTRTSFLGDKIFGNEISRRNVAMRRRERTMDAVFEIKREIP